MDIINLPPQRFVIPDKLNDDPESIPLVEVRSKWLQDQAVIICTNIDMTWVNGMDSGSALRLSGMTKV